MGYRDYLLKEEAKDLNVPPALARKLAELVKFGLLEKGSKMINRYIANTGMSVEEHEEAIHKMLDAAANAIERFATYSKPEDELPDEEPEDSDDDLEVIVGDEIDDVIDDMDSDDEEEGKEYLRRSED